jgi:hypothetical protein
MHHFSQTVLRFQRSSKLQGDNGKQIKQAKDLSSLGLSFRKTLKKRSTQNSDITRKRDGMVYKCLAPSWTHTKRLASAMAGRDHESVALRYIDSLRHVGVRLPPKIHVVTADPLKVGHEWIEGPMLSDLLEADLSRVMGHIERIGDWQMRLQMDGLDARIDTNLDNFIVDCDGPVLVDVIPPLIPSRGYVPEDLFEELFLPLCLSFTVSTTALIGYALRGSIGRVDLALANRVTALAERWSIWDYLTSHGREPMDIFAARLRLALDALLGASDGPEVLGFYRATSVEHLASLTELARARQLKEAWKLYDQLTQPCDEIE